ncbi:MAG: carboxypeptidase regulatory-like domain-containing protein [Planctomycetota bacterium]|nr:MAG: carboxypeptidase regulatory-like domain-containing protein [Planctomycetota bacterium]
MRTKPVLFALILLLAVAMVLLLRLGPDRENLDREGQENRDGTTSQVQHGEEVAEEAENGERENLQPAEAAEIRFDILVQGSTGEAVAKTKVMVYRLKEGKPQFRNLLGLRITDSGGRCHFSLKNSPAQEPLEIQVGGQERWAAAVRKVATPLTEPVHQITVQLEPGFSLHGRLLDEQGKALAGVPLHGWNTVLHSLNFKKGKIQPELPHFTVTTNALGEFQIYGLSGSFSLAAYNQEIVSTLWLYGKLPNGKPAKGFELRAVRAKKVKGKVVDEMGRAVAGARIHATPDHVWRRRHPGPVEGSFFSGELRVEAVSDSSGRFELFPIGAETWRVGASAKDLSDWEGLLASEEKEITIHLKAGASFHGRLLDPFGNPIAGADIENLNDQKTKTDGQGRFFFAGLEESEDLILATHVPGYAVLVEQTPLQQSGKLDLVLEPGLALAGKVQKEDGTPVSGVQLQIQGDRKLPLNWIPTPSWESHFQLNRTVSDEEGGFRFKDLYAGEFLIETLPRDRDEGASLNARSGTENLVLTLGRHARATVTVRGRVLNQNNGNPIPGATVTAMQVRTFEYGGEGASGKGSAKTGEDGSFEIGGLEPGRYYLAARAKSFAPNETEKEEWQEGELVLDLNLFPSRQLRLRVLDVSGKPYPGAKVQAVGPNDKSLMFRSSNGGSVTPIHTGPDGSVTLLPLPATTVEVSISGSSYLPVERRSVNLSFDDQELEVKLPYPYWSEIRGVYLILKPFESIDQEVLVKAFGEDGSEFYSKTVRPGDPGEWLSEIGENSVPFKQPRLFFAMPLSSGRFEAWKQGEMIGSMTLPAVEQAAEMPETLEFHLQ